MENVKFFKKQADLRKWFEKNHKKLKEQWIGFYKKNSGKPSITWPESVDEALCFGWIDGIRKSINEESYKIRFTPRNPKSIWSKVNINKVKDLKKKGLMKPEGLELFNKMDKTKAEVYSFEQQKISLDKKYEKILKKNKTAWKFFQAQVPSYKKPAVHWIMSAKQEETRLRRLNILIENSEAGEKIPPLRRQKK